MGGEGEELLDARQLAKRRSNTEILEAMVAEQW
jgi:hypothetical protein